MTTEKRTKRSKNNNLHALPGKETTDQTNYMHSGIPIFRTSKENESSKNLVVQEIGGKLMYSV